MFFESFTSSKDKSGSTAQQTKQHQTHVAALVMIVFLTLVVVFIALSMVDQQAPRSSADNRVQSETQQTNTSHMQRVSGTGGLPADLPVPESADIVQNHQNDLTNNQTQRVLVFQISQELAESFKLPDELQNWATQNEFAVTQTSRSNGSGIILAEKPNGQLIISWTEDRETMRVEVNHTRI